MLYNKSNPIIQWIKKKSPILVQIADKNVMMITAKNAIAVKSTLPKHRKILNKSSPFRREILNLTRKRPICNHPATSRKVSWKELDKKAPLAGTFSYGRSLSIRYCCFTR